MLTLKINISLPWESYGGMDHGREGKAYNHPSYQVQAGLTVLGRHLSFLGPAFLSCVQRQELGRLSTFFASLGVVYNSHVCKVCCYFSCSEIQSSVGGSTKEKSK